MKEWLLKDEKNKVGRPKLANEELLKKAKISIALGVILIFVLMFSSISILKGESPIKHAYSLTFEKIFGMIENKNGFIVKDYYDKDYNYIMKFNVPEVVYNYSGSYKYTLYEFNKNEWKEKETKTIDKSKREFSLKINSLKNQNKTWKIKLQIVNANKITKSYAPASWYFNESEKVQNMYAYKVFTVKGYYSPVTSEEIKLANKNTDKISVYTKRDNPRKFYLKLPNGEYNVSVYYTDSLSKNVLLEKGVATGIKEYEVPALKRSSKVTFKIAGPNVTSNKLSNWKEENGLITNSYILKPEEAY